MIVNSTSWQALTRTSYSQIQSYFSAVPQASGTTRKYYLVLRRADSQPGGNGSNWRFSCNAAWNGGTNIAGHGFVLGSNYGSIDEGTIDWVEIPPAAVSGANCPVGYWQIDAEMLNSGQAMRVMSISLAMMDIPGGTNSAYLQAAAGNTVQAPMSLLHDSLWLDGPNGYIGIGRTDPHNYLDISTQLSKTNTTETSPLTISTNESYGSNPFMLYLGIIGASTNAARTAVLQTTNYAVDNLGNLSLQPHAGNVGIGTTSPTAKLEVAGNIKLTSGSGASMTFADGTTQTTAWTGTVCGGDYAESVDVSGERKHYEPGDVLVIDPSSPGKFFKSTEPYSTMVTGVYSTKPGTVGRRQLTPKSEDEVPMAMIGIVPVKVTTENGSIHPGDLLVTSSKPGYAMKGTDRSRMFGAVIGKAVGILSQEIGVIEMVVALQ